jgi:hypothetical protein
MTQSRSYLYQRSRRTALSRQPAAVAHVFPLAPEVRTSQLPTAISAEEIQQALWLVLRSAIFAKAPRASQLLRFLVDRSSCAAADLSACTIAAEVFGRDPDAFDPSLDPIVRVQVGRLRDKLNRYYCDGECAAPLRFEIPVGTCMPVVTRARLQPAGSDAAAIQFVAVKLIGSADGRGFCRGFNEQLLYELYRAFGSRISVPGATARHLHRRLEGSLRVEDSRVRVSLRLIDSGSGRLLWAHQLDRGFEHSIRQQEQLALAVCAALRPQM